MNKLYPFFVAVLIVLGTASCKPELVYKYNQNLQPVSCTQLDKDLMHEALYSFEQDIAAHYNFRGFDPAEPMYIHNGYSTYVYGGATNTAPFLDIYTEHSKQILIVLEDIDGLFYMVDGQYDLNYEHPYMQCVIENIANDDLRVSIQSLLTAGSYDTNLMASPFRKKAVESAKDKNLAMFMALATYYKNLLNKNVHQIPTNE